MADEKHWMKLLTGVAAWNEWRAGNPNVTPLLEGALLAGTNLCNANLEGANLSGAYLSGTNLGPANLSYANLSKADLSDANLLLANLSYANLSGANLLLTNLSSANLADANLARANLTMTNLSGATLSGTVMTDSLASTTWFVGLSLKGITGLSLIKHTAPSYISIDTLERTAADLGKDATKQEQHGVELFLENAGVPKEYIEFFRSRIGQRIQFYSCFISYSTKDQAFADRLHSDLRQKGIRCWLATEDLRIGDKFRTRINEAIRAHDKLMVVLSQESVKSSWVEEEVEAAFERETRDGGTVLFPISLDDAVMDSNEAWAASIRRIRHIGDFRRWKDHDEYTKSLERLVRDLRPENAGQKASGR